MKAHVSNEVIKTRLEEAARYEMIVNTRQFATGPAIYDFKYCFYQTALDYANGVGDARFAPAGLAKKAKAIYEIVKAQDQSREWESERGDRKMKDFFHATERFGFHHKVRCDGGSELFAEGAAMFKTEIDLDMFGNFRREELAATFLFLAVRAKAYWSAMRSDEIDVTEEDLWK